MKKSVKISLASVILTILLVIGGIITNAADEVCLLGDSDCDGRVTINDATAIQRYLVRIVTFSETQEIVSDADCDEMITINDVTAIQRYLVGIKQSYPIGEPVEIEEPTEITTEPETTEEPTTYAEETTEEPTTYAEETTVEPTTYAEETTMPAATEEETTEPASSEEESTEPTTVNPDAWKENTGTIVLGTPIQVTGVGAEVDGNIVRITEGGDWEVTGSLDDGMIYVDTGEVKDDNDKVKLRLNGMSLTNQSGPAIYFDRCKKAFITIEADSVNTLCDSAVYSTENAEAKATLHSDDTLEIKGKGTLNVTSNYKHGINSDDDILIENGVFNINAVTDGLHANDNITIDGKNVNLNIESGSDGIECEVDVVIVSGTINVNAAGKGIKAATDINISGGVINVDSTDDAIHSNANITISGGTIALTSGDDGIHSDTKLTISGGEIDVKKSYEGIESLEIVIDGGTINVVSSDDAINAAGGNDGSSTSGRPGQNGFKPGSDSTSTTVSGSISINGGYICAVATGDVIDSNGTLTISGGTIIVQGPSSGGNSCLDADSTITYTGGTVFGVSSSSAMWSDFTGKLSSVSIYKTSLGSVSSNTTIAVTDSSGNVLSILDPAISGTLGAVYMTDKTTALTSCNFVIGGTYSGTLDSNGYAEGGTVSGGTTVSPSTSSGSSQRPW